MTSDNLENLVRMRQLKKEPPRDDELAGLKHSGLARLEDAERPGLSFESRFDLAYNAAHALGLYALRRLGYRPEKRYLVFQVLPETTGLAIAHSRVLSKAHAKRNLSEYEGYQDERLLMDLLTATRVLADLLKEQP